MEKSMSSMKSIQIQLTTVCNERCVFCEKWTWPVKQMPAHILSSVLYEYHEADSFQFSGGEPLMYESLADLNHFLSVSNKPYKVFTNLSLPVMEPSDRYTFLKNATEISTSLDSVIESEYNSLRRPLTAAAFEHVIENIMEFAEKVKACMVVTNQNYKSVMEVHQWCEKHGVKNRFYNVHTHDELALNEEQRNELSGQIYDYLVDFDAGQSNLMAFLGDLCSIETNEFIPCHVRNAHRVIDEDGKAYTCCYAINDNGPYEEQKNALVTDYYLNPELAYGYCKKCTRYKHANRNWNTGSIPLFL